MHYLVAYDVSDDRGRARVAALASAWGDRIQQSVFECHLVGDEAPELLAAMESWVDVETDSVHLVPICSSCDGARRLIGQAVRQPPELCWVL